MKNYSIQSLHLKLDKNIKLAESYSEIPELGFIIKSCRLKPYSYFFEERDSSIKLYKHWFDEFGNSLKIIKSKKISIINNDLSLDRSKIICTDLYYGLSLENQYKISKLSFIVNGKDDDGKDINIVCFLGIDNYLRCFLFYDNKWITVSPLFLGIKYLKLIANHLDVKYFLNFKNKKDFPTPFQSGEAWLSFSPLDDNLITELDRKTNIVDFFKMKGYYK